MPTHCLMVVGTGSHVGKTFLVAGLCRILAQDGHRVAPFKAQNMALNSFVTREGGEMGRAQVMQAEAASIEPHVDMNPILLKPTNGMGAQVIVHGKPLTNLSAKRYYSQKNRLWKQIVASFRRLCEQYDIIVIEGAGSPAEMNLKPDDIVNMRVAKMAAAPTILVGDIDRGGVFASLIGTIDLLDPEEQALIKGLVVNKFRGDRSLFNDGVRFLQARTGKPVLGVVPYLPDLLLDQEDSVDLMSVQNPVSAVKGEIGIAVIRLPHLSNFTDFSPLQAMAGVSLRYVSSASEIGQPNAIIIPGTKNTLADLQTLRECGFFSVLQHFIDAGGHCIGICGGFQMLGREVRDPHRVESHLGAVEGLNLLPMTTTMQREKQTAQVKGRLLAPDFFPETSGELHGYEIHQGETELDEGMTPLIQITARSSQPAQGLDGAILQSGRVWGTYLHGIFDNDTFRLAFINRLRTENGLPKVSADTNFSVVHEKQRQYNRLATHLRESLDISQIYRIMGVVHGK